MNTYESNRVPIVARSLFFFRFLRTTRPYNRTQFNSKRIADNPWNAPCTHTYTRAHVRSEGRDSRGREKETRRAPRARIFDGSPGAEGREGEHANKLALYLKQLLGIAVTHERGSGPYCGPSETTVRAGDEERRVESGLREAAERGVVAEEVAKEAKERARSRGRK